MNRNLEFWRQFDFVLLAITALLVGTGILVIRSATLDAIDTDIIARVPVQIQYAIIGFLLIFAIAALDYRILSGLSFWLYLTSIILLALVPFIGQEGAGGAQRWISFGILIQPSEISKILLILTLAHFFATRLDQMNRFRTVILSLIHIGIPAALIFIQPDLGTTIVIGVIWFALAWGAGLRIRHIALLVMIGILLLPLFFSLLEDYQINRLRIFLFQEIDPDAQYNIDQALISIGSGGISGKGYTEGTQNRGRFLRVRHTDFIFSVLAEEFGMVGSLTVIALIGMVLWRILKAAQYAPDAMGSLICYGVAAVIFFQTTVSIGMNLNLMPVTGLTLPFISSGGTSLLSTMAGIGLAESVVMRSKK